jgi:hypothetical protein
MVFPPALFSTGSRSANRVAAESMPPPLAARLILMHTALCLALKARTPGECLRQPHIASLPPSNFPLKLAPAAGGRSTLVTDTASWFSTYDEFDFKLQVTGGAVPPDKAGQIALVPLVLAQLDTFKDAHP